MRRPRRPILLVGIDDAEIRAVAGALDELGFPYHFLGTRMPIELGVSRSRIAWRLGPGVPAITWSPGASAPRPFAAVYTRVLALAPTHPFDSPHWTRENFLRAGFYDGEILGLKLALLRHLQAWRIPMYNGFAAADMEVKAFRLLRMREAGLPVPESLFTQDGKSVRKLAARRKRIVYKAVAGGAEASILAPRDLLPERLGLLARAPVTFQEMVPGRDLRLYVCDSEVLASVLIHSDREVDSRGRETGYEPIRAPVELARAAVTACRLFGLRFSAVDLRLGDDGSFALLECNNHPMFAAIDAATGGAVARGLAARLARGEA